jgi:hypothetical protein
VLDEVPAVEAGPFDNAKRSLDYLRSLET